MKLMIKLFGMLLLVAGISLLINSEIIIGWIEDNAKNTLLYFSAIVARLVFGLLFIIAAKESKYPGAIKFIGYLAVIAAIIFIFIGRENFQHFFSSLIPEIKPYAPLTGLVVLAIGGFLIFAFSRNKKLE